MENKTNLEELAPQLFSVIEKAQNYLAEWIVPDSKITDSEVLNSLLGVLDDQELVKNMRSVVKDMGWTEKYYPPSSPNCEWVRYHSALSGTMELKFKNGQIYQYFDFPKELYDSMIKAPSIGSFIAREVKGNYRYANVNGD